MQVLSFAVDIINRTLNQHEHEQPFEANLLGQQEPCEINCNPSKFPLNFFFVGILTCL